MLTLYSVIVSHIYTHQEIPIVKRISLTFKKEYMMEVFEYSVLRKVKLEGKRSLRMEKLRTE
jgi:hypothetical protein